MADEIHRITKETLEKLEAIPEPGTALKIGVYEFEVLQTADNSVRTVRVRIAPPRATQG